MDATNPNEPPDAQTEDGIVDDSQDALSEFDDGEPASPTGAGWIIQIAGYHFHNEDYHAPFEGRTYLRTTFIDSFLGGRGEIVPVTAGPMAGEKVLPEEIGLGFPVIIESSPIQSYWLSTAVDSVGYDGDGMGPSQDASQGIDLKRYDFIIQFVWQPKTPGAVELIPETETGEDY